MPEMDEMANAKTRRPQKTWHDSHRERLTFADRLADTVAAGMGSWTFIIVQSAFVVMWMLINLIGFLNHWDPYPFILLNLVFSTQAAYAAPIIMQSQNRQSRRDREHAQHDYETNLAAKQEIEMLMETIAALELRKIDKIMKHLGISEDEISGDAKAARLSTYKKATS